MSKVEEFIKSPKTHDEIHIMTDELTGLKNKKSKTTTDEENQLWALVYDYLDFHANQGKEK